MLTGAIGELAARDIRVLRQWREVEVLELSVQADHLYPVCSIPPKLSMLAFMRLLKRKLAIKLFKSYLRLKRKPYWENHFWARSYFVSTVRAEEQLIRRYLRHQEEREREEERERKDYELFRNQPPPREP